jgi:hypothetical protein
MKNITTLIFILTVIFSTTAQKIKKNKIENENAIRKILDEQVAAWNLGNLEEFMKGYWKSDSILFIGSKITSGWDSTLVRYKRTYPDRAAMGKLRFEILRMDFISSSSYLVTGKYFLTREEDSPSGIFTLLFKRKKESWLIVYDHTS